MPNFHREILQVLEKATMPYSHQKLDMWLISAGSDPGVVSSGLLEALRELERAGLVGTVAGASPGSPLYAITEAGRRELDPVTAAAERTPAVA